MRYLSNIILLDNAQQYNDLLEGKSVTLASGTVLTELDTNAEYKVPADMITQYHIKIEFGVDDAVKSYLEFDIFSSSAALFSTSKTNAENWETLRISYSGRRIPVAYKCESDAYNAIGAVVLTFPTTSTAFAEVQGSVYDIDHSMSASVVEAFIPAQIRSFTF